jgi:SAM-dependent methyltransferase
MMGYSDDSNNWMVFEKHVAPLIEPDWSIIEMGPGKVRRSLVRQFAEERGCEYHFADRKNQSPEHPGHIPMKSDFAIGTFCNRFDAAISFAMLHNVRQPWRWLPEVARVVKRGGLVCIVDCVTWDVNRYPVDCGRWFPDGIDCLFDEAGLETVVNLMENIDKRELARKHQIGNALPVHLAAVGRKA